MKKGFTLIELLVVVLIMGILASVSVPYYYKTVETSKATDSVAIGHLLGNAYRMFRIDNPGTQLQGQITDNCNGISCVNVGANDACRLVACNYVAKQQWSQSSYNFFVGPGSCGGGMAACTRRANGTGDYAGWGYNFNDNGGCSSFGNGVPDCPKF